MISYTATYQDLVPEAGKKPHQQKKKRAEKLTTITTKSVKVDDSDSDYAHIDVSAGCGYGCVPDDIRFFA